MTVVLEGGGGGGSPGNVSVCLFVCLSAHVNDHTIRGNKVALETYLSVCLFGCQSTLTIIR